MLLSVLICRVTELLPVEPRRSRILFQFFLVESPPMASKRLHEKTTTSTAGAADLVPAKAARIAGPVVAAPTWDWRDPKPFEDSRETMTKVVSWVFWLAESETCHVSLVV